MKGRPGDGPLSLILYSEHCLSGLVITAFRKNSEKIQIEGRTSEAGAV